MIPEAVTSGELARVLGVSERRVAAVKAEGRISTAGDGGINLAALVRLGWNAALEKGREERARRQQGQRPDAAEAFDNGMRVAASTTAHAVLGAILAARDEDPCAAAARGLSAAMDLLDVPAHPDPEYRRPERLRPHPPLPGDDYPEGED